MIKIFERSYCGEGIIDIEQDVSEALSESYNPVMSKVPADEWGISKGTIKVTIEWMPDDDEG